MKSVTMSICSGRKRPARLRFIRLTSAPKASRYFTFLTCISIIGSFMLAVLGEIFLEPLAKIMGADEEMLPVCLNYGRILIFSIPFYVLQNVFQSFLTAAERPKIGLAINLFSAAVNLFLDYIFVGVCDMGVTGAAPPRRRSRQLSKSSTAAISV